MTSTKFKDIKVLLTEENLERMYEFYCCNKAVLSYPEDIGEDGGRTEEEYDLISSTCSMVESINRSIIVSNPKLLNSPIKLHGKEYKIVNPYGELYY